MRIMMIGDVVGRPGRTVLREHLADLKKRFRADRVVVNGENASGGNGLTEKNARQLLALDIDVLTMGNHVWKQRETVDYIGGYPQIVRPLNYPKNAPGRGYAFYDWAGVRACVLNASGQTFMEALDSPFAAIDAAMAEIRANSDIFLVDFHAETTSEKIAMGYYLDGKASAVVGTHTHVQTADARILPGGTAYITDLGMTGPLNGVIGVKKDIILHQMITKMPARYEVEKEKPWQLGGVVIDVDPVTGRASRIERIYEIYEDDERKAKA
ncbi:TIGR00282 family metallophosphoesterase [Pseudoramibacter alactolyticus]